MLTEQELNAALNLSRQIERLQNKLDDLMETGGVGSPNISPTPVQGGPGMVSPGQIAAELAEEIQNLTHQWEIEREIIKRSIEKIPLDDIERKVALLRYVECRPWKIIESSVGYSKPHIMRIHSGALTKMIHDDTP